MRKTKKCSATRIEKHRTSAGREILIIRVCDLGREHSHPAHHDGRGEWADA